MKNFSLVLLGFVLGILLCYGHHNHGRVEKLEKDIKVLEYQIEQVNENISVQNRTLIKLIDAMPTPQPIGSRTIRRST